MFGNCFAAGIFLLVGMVHLLKEAQESFVEAIGKELPIGYIVCIGGYTLILFVENILFGAHSHSLENEGEDHVQENNPVTVVPDKAEDQNIASKDLTKIIASSEVRGNDIEHQHHHHDGVNEKMPGIILTTALVIHSLFEGIAAGIISSESVLITLNSAILIHNIPAAFSLGVKIEFFSKPWRISLMLAFIISSPLGIAIGIWISNLEYPIIQAIFLSISAGTFLYIGSTEILPEQFHEKEHRWLKFFGFILGYVPLAIMSVFIKS